MPGAEKFRSTMGNGQSAWGGPLAVLDPRVRLWVHQGLVPVVVAHEVRRTAVLAARLNNDSRVLLPPDHLALEVEPVTNRCSHPLLHSLLPLLSVVDMAAGRKTQDGISVTGMEEMRRRAVLRHPGTIESDEPRYG